MTLFAIWADKCDSRDTSTTDLIHEALVADSIIEPCSPSRGTVGRLHWHVQDYPTRFYDIGARLHVGDGCTILSGYTWLRGGDVLDAHDIHAMVGERDILDLRSVLGGEFTVAHVGSNGALTGLADPAGIQSLFYCDTPEVFAVSNRVGMLRHLIQEADTDLESSLGILAIGYRVGPGTACRHIRTVPQMAMSGLSMADLRLLTGVAASSPNSGTLAGTRSTTRSSSLRTASITRRRPFA